MHQLNDKYIVPLPNGAKNVEIYDKETLPVALMFYVYNEEFKIDMPWVIPLPSGSWQIICTSETVTEEVAAGLVEKDTITDLYRCYRMNALCHDTALASLSSYLAANNINSPYVILGKI